MSNHPDDFKGTPYDLEGDTDSAEAIQAAKSMAFIKAKVRELDKLIYSCSSYFDIDLKKATHAKECMGEALSEMLGNEWREAYNAYPCLLYREEFPTA